MKQIIKAKVKKVESAVNSSMTEIQKLLLLNINERTLSCLISKHLSDFSVGEISVDPEYNKHLDNEKTMSLKKYIKEHRKNKNEGKEFDCTCVYCKKIKSNEKFNDTKRSKIPDIVIHKRNSDECNETVIEIKKNKKCLWDYLKLRYMTSSSGMYRYKLGIFIYFPQNNPKYTYFIGGSEETL